MSFLQHAKSIQFDNSASGYTATQMQDALDEAVSNIGSANTSYVPSKTVILDPNATAVEGKVYNTWYAAQEYIRYLPAVEVTGADTTAVNGSYVHDGDDKYYGYNDFHNGVASAGLTIPFANYFEFKPAVSYSFPLSNDAEDWMEARSFDGSDSEFFTGGATISMVF